MKLKDYSNSKELEDTFVQIDKFLAHVLYLRLDVFGLDDEGHESLIEYATDLDKWEVFVIERET